MREPQLCVTVAGPTMDDLRRSRDAVNGADLVELRLDLLADASKDRPDVAAALHGRRTPVIVTCRAQWEGGGFTGTEDDRRRILESALELGAEWIDVEAAASFTPDFIRSRAGRGIVVSEHSFDRMPADLGSRYDAIKATGAEVVKLATRIDSLEQLRVLLDLGRRAADDGQRHVLIGMGSVGLPSRILAARLGNSWTYAGDGVAPGQIPASRLLNDFQFRRVRPDAALYGVVGNPISHSLSPVMHNAGFEALGLNAVYVPLEAQSPDDLVQFAKEFDLRGVSITAPFKIGLMAHVDEIDTLAARVGAINTIVVRNGRWIGANTDVEGFLSPLAQHISLRGARVTVVGAGGAARAVAVALASEGARVTICARRSEAAQDIATLVHGVVGDFPPKASSWDVLVNASSAGGYANPVNPIEGAPLDGEIVFDLVYAPAETALLAAARRAGCLTIGGLEMLIAQAERQFELWTGQRPPNGLFEAAARGRELSRTNGGPTR
jgi:3-dehydroquinate dehydratase / shikimate dehydrogenase